MTKWQPLDDSDCFYFLVDSKPDEMVQSGSPHTVFCTAFVSTASCFKGVVRADLPWLKEYKNSESLVESIDIVEQLVLEIIKGNFCDLHAWVLSSRFGTIDSNGLRFLQGLEKEVASFRIDGRNVWHGTNRFA